MRTAATTTGDERNQERTAAAPGSLQESGFRVALGAGPYLSEKPFSRPFQMYTTHNPPPIAHVENVTLRKLA